MKTHRLEIRTSARNDFVDITTHIEELLSAGNALSGLITIFTPHTTAGLTINENADPDVRHDLQYKLSSLIPKNETAYRHAEGNSDSHLKSSLFSPSLSLIYENGRLLLGTWQAIYFSEFDGPRTRQIFIKIIEDK